MLLKLFFYTMGIFFIWSNIGTVVKNNTVDLYHETFFLQYIIGKRRDFTSIEEPVTSHIDKNLHSVDSSNFTQKLRKQFIKSNF